MGDYDFNIEDLNSNVNNEKQNIIDYLKSSEHRSRIFLLCVHLKINITVKKISNYYKNNLKFRMADNQVREYLHDFVSFGLIHKGKLNRKTLVFNLNRDFEKYKEYIPTCKEVLDIE